MSIPIKFSLKIFGSLIDRVCRKEDLLACAQNASSFQECDVHEESIKEIQCENQHILMQKKREWK